MDGCGIAYWHPQWLQKYAKPSVFIVIYSLFRIIQLAGSIYLYITIPTLEKVFKIPSKITGMILSGNDISQVALSLILSYFGGRNNIPKWLSFGVVCKAVSFLILALPFFIYGVGEDVLQYTQEYSAGNQSILLELKTNKNRQENRKICQNSTIFDSPPKSDGDFLYVPLILMFVSQMVLGVGSTLVSSLGTTYIDNNVKGRNFPLILSISNTIGMVGPVLGYGFVYIILRIFVVPTLTPLISHDDLRWIGAWWLGCIIIGISMAIFAGIISLFPKSLKKKEIKLELDRDECDKEKISEQKIEENKNKGMKDFPKAIWRLLTNKLLMFACLSNTFNHLRGSGNMSFRGRVMEVQFNKTAAGGFAFTGPIINIGVAIGIISSGFVMKKYKPRTSYLFYWNVFVGLITFSCITLGYAQLGCDNRHSSSVNRTITSCNANCNCDGIAYSPVCDHATNVTYFSACEAGCRIFNAKEKVYKNCSCSKGASNGLDMEHNMSSGACVENCDFDYYVFTFLSMISNIFFATCGTSFSLILLRSVDPQDKALAYGLDLFITCLFGTIPGPIIFGHVIDNACLIWNHKGGKRGNCLLYDSVKFRHNFHYTYAFFLAIALCFTFMIAYYGKDLDLYGDSSDDKEKTTKKQEDNIYELEPLNVQQ